MLFPAPRALSYRASTLTAMAEVDKHELAEQVVITVAAGLAGYLGPGAGALAAGSVPLALAGLDRIASIIGSRRLEHDVETLLDGAEAFGAETVEEFMEFVEAAVSDEDRQELLARTLTIAQDTAMRDKRRALGRALAAAASDTGTKVDPEMLFVRILADLDEPHIRLLRLLSTDPPEVPMQPGVTQVSLPGINAPRQWYPSLIAQADAGLAATAWSLLGTLSRHQLASDSIGTYTTPIGTEELHYSITQYGRWFLSRLAEPEDSSGSTTAAG